MSGGKRMAIGAAALAAGAVVVGLVVLGGRPGGSSVGGPAAWTAEQRGYIAERHDAAAEMIDHAEFGQARVLLEQLIDRFPKDAAGHGLLAQVYFAMGREDKALEAASRAVELDPAQAGAADLAGILSEGRGDVEKASRLYAAAVEARPASPKYRLQLANALLKLDRLDEAEAEAVRALSLDPTLPLGHAVLGYAARRRDDDGEAADRFRVATRLAERPRRRLAWSIELARSLRAQGEAGAAEAINVLMSLPEDWRSSEREITAELARAQAARGRHADAAGAWRTWLNANPDDADAAARAGRAYLEAAERAEAPDMRQAYLAAAEQFHQRGSAIDAKHPRVIELGDALAGSDNGQ